MRLFLSSYRLGDHPERLTALLRTGRPAAVVANAVDELPARARAGAGRRVKRDIAAVLSRDLPAQCQS